MISQSSKNVLFGGIEAGGTNFNCVIGFSNGEIIAHERFSTTNPIETLEHARYFFEESISLYGYINALGIAHFGPVGISHNSTHYGKILETTKPGWSNTDVVGYFSSAFGFPITFQSDANGAAIGEYNFGSAKDIDNFVYITVGTGIGGGVFVNGELQNRLSHPEIGHMLIPQDVSKDSFIGSCPFHKNCLEGLASGHSIDKRWGMTGEELESNHPAWELEAHYLAILCVNLTYSYSPEKIIFGGGVMQQKQLIPLVREKFIALMQGYSVALHNKSIEEYIIQSSLINNSTKGALVLAHQAHNSLYGITNIPSN